MAILIVIVCGAAGGLLGWFFDRKARRQEAGNPQPAETCQTST